MKVSNNINQLAFLKYPRVINDPYNPMEDDNEDNRKIWIDAYTQFREDIQKEIKPLINIYKSDIIRLEEEFKDSCSVLTLESISILQHIVNNLESILKKQE